MKRKSTFRRPFAILVGIIFSSFASAGSVFPIRSDQLPEMTPTGNYQAFRDGLSIQLARCTSVSKTKIWNLGNRKATPKEWCTQTLSKLLQLAKESENFKQLIARSKTAFDWYQSVGDNGAGQVHYTGYYLPELRAKRIPNAVYRYPIYRSPASLQNKALFFSRLEIDWMGKLANQNLEIAYTDDRIKLFFVHIQGSGVLKLVDEQRENPFIYINYQSSNGHEYVPIGRIMRDEGVDPTFISMPGIIQYFSERPGEADRLLPLNPSYIFFQEMQTGPYGAWGTKLVDGHSVAVDAKHYPLGSVGFAATQKAVIEENEVIGFEGFSRFVLTHDVGGAIKGAGRVDFYFGQGNEAELSAGVQNHYGTLYFLIAPRQSAHKKRRRVNH